MEIILYSRFKKRENSTAVPGETEPKAKMDGYLKDPTSVINPVITIDNLVNSPQNVFINYVYAYIPDFKRYYFINDIVSDGELWTLYLNIDPLATFKNVIEDTMLYCLRSSKRYNGLITDTYYPATFERQSYIKGYKTQWQQLSYSNGPQIDITEGCFVVGIVAKPTGSGKGSYGSIRYYALKQDELKDLVTALLDNTITEDNHFSTDDATLVLQKGLLNPLSYIKSCMYLPCSLSLLPGSYSNHLNVWDWDLETVDCRVLTGNTPYIISSDEQYTIHHHPQAASRGAYLNAAPYSRINLLYPPFGMFEIDTSQIVNGGELHTSVILDYITGLGTLDIYVSVPENEQMNGTEKSLNLLQRIKAQVGVPIQLSEVGYDYTNMGLTLLGGALDIVKGSFAEQMDKYLGSSISNSVSQISSAVNAMRTKASTVGSNGGFSEIHGQAVLYEEYFIIAREDRTHVGRPLCEIIRLKDEGSGYYLFRSGNISVDSATLPELNMIRNYLESGIYYE